MKSLQPPFSTACSITRRCSRSTGPPIGCRTGSRSDEPGVWRGRRHHGHNCPRAVARAVHNCTIRTVHVSLDNQHTSIDTDAHWTKSGWHGWVYGGKLHLITTVAAVWIPLAAELTPANVADNVQALRLLPELPGEVRYVLGDQHYNDPAIDAAGAGPDWTVVATRRGPYRRTDDGVGVRRLLHELRSRAI